MTSVWKEQAIIKSIQRRIGSPQLSLLLHRPTEITFPYGSTKSFLLNAYVLWVPTGPVYMPRDAQVYLLTEMRCGQQWQKAQGGLRLASALKEHRAHTDRLGAS